MHKSRKAIDQQQKAEMKRKLIFYAEYEIGENISENELQQLMDKGFDHAMSEMIQNLNLKPITDFVRIPSTKEFNPSDWLPNEI